MNGEGGDILFAPQPYWLLDLYAANRRQAIYRTVQWARQRDMSPFGIVACLPFVQRTAYDKALQRVSMQIRRGVRAITEESRRLDLRVVRANSEASWLTAEASHRVADIVEAFSATVDHSMFAGSVNDWMMVRQTCGNAALTRTLAHGAGVSIEEPYYDALVLQTCLSVPGHERSPSNTYKPLIKRAVPGMPAMLRDRIGKDLPQGWVERTLSSHHEVVGDWIDRSLLVQSGVLRPDALREQLYGLRLGLPVRQYALDGVLAAEVWMRNLDLTRTRWWE